MAKQLSDPDGSGPSVDLRSGEASFSAGEAASRCGLSRQGLLSWERRYGFPNPTRNERGHRRYSAHDLRTISLVKASVDRGKAVPAAIEEARAAGHLTAATGEAPPEVLRSALDNMPLPVAILRAPEFTYAYVNIALAQLVSRARLGEPIQAVLEGIKGIGALEAVARTGEPWVEDEEPVVLNGELRFFASRYSRLPATPGQPHHVLGIGWDTTEAVRARRRLVRSEELLSVRAVEATRESAMLRTLDAFAKGLDADAANVVSTLVRRLSRDLDADGVTAAIFEGGGLQPRISSPSPRGLRWHRVDLSDSRTIEESFERDSLVWLQTSRVRNRKERALLRRMVAKTLCCAPVTRKGQPIGALLIRWSIAEHQPSVSETAFLDIVRRFVRHELGASGSASARSRPDSLDGTDPDIEGESLLP